jgi:hypothetical protein
MNNSIEVKGMAYPSPYYLRIKNGLDKKNHIPLLAILLGR